MLESISFKNLHYPEGKDLKDELLFLCNSIGIIGDDNVRVFIDLFVKSKYGKGITENELSMDLDISLKRIRGILNNLMNSGFIRKSRDRYLLRENTLSITLENIMNDVFMISRNLMRACVSIDRKATKNAVHKLLKEWSNC